MKRIISITIALCLVFCSVLPVYAEAWTSGQANSVTTNVQNIYQYLRDFLLSYNDGTVSNWTFGDLYWEVHRLASWIAPVGSNDGSYETLWSVLMNIAIDTRSYLPSIPNIANFISNWMVTNNNNLTELVYGLTNYSPGIHSLTNTDIFRNAHLSLDWVYENGVNTGVYNVQIIQPNGLTSAGQTHWNVGSPIGNLAYLLYRDIQNNSAAYSYRWVADLKHYNDNLTTWDSQGSTLTQVAFTPESAIQGLYRYLAFTQRDVARLAYVFANDEELEARELAQANQEQVMDDFIDPNGSGSASTSDIEAISDISSGYKNNFGSDAQVTGIFNIFNSNNMGWFSQETKNQLDTTSPSRSKSDTPLLDKQIQDIYEAIGVVPDESR